MRSVKEGWGVPVGGCGGTLSPCIIWRQGCWVGHTGVGGDGEEVGGGHAERSWKDESGMMMMRDDLPARGGAIHGVPGLLWHSSSLFTHVLLYNKATPHSIAARRIGGIPAVWLWPRTNVPGPALRLVRAYPTHPRGSGNRAEGQLKPRPGHLEGRCLLL